MSTMSGREYLRAKDALLRAAYRGLLNREPDGPAAAALQSPRFSPAEEAELAHTLTLFVESDEFQRRAPQQQKLPDFAPSTWARIEIGQQKLWIDIGDQGVSRHCVSGTYETAETTFVRNNLSTGMTFVDIGANIGWFTINAAGIVGPTGRVVSFEPRHDTFNALTRSIQDNGYEDF